MPSVGLKSLANKQFLNECWLDLYGRSKKRKRDSFGVDGISINSFKSNPKALIDSISSDLKANTYSPDLLIPHFIPKANGKDRVICVPTIPDRLVQRALLRLLHEKGYAFSNSINFGFVKGRSVSDAAERAVLMRTQQPWVYKADIAQFFDTIDRDLLLEKVRKKIRLSSLHHLIEQIIRNEIYCKHAGITKRITKMGIKKGTGLRQGMPASPYLANVMLSDFDKEIEKRKLPLIRYADDIIAFGKNREECERIHEICTSLLNDEKLFVHPVGSNKKTTIASPTETVEFLGLGLAQSNGGYELIVTENQLGSLRQKIMQVSDLDYCLKSGISISKLTKQIGYMIDGYISAYEICSNHEQLEHSVLSAKSLALKQLFIKGFKIDYERLNNKQKRFLEILESSRSEQ